jgi:cell division transport system permease protein
VAGQLSREIELMPFIGAADVIAIGPLLIVAGAGIAALSSVIALRRFLDV